MAITMQQDADFKPQQDGAQTDIQRATIGKGLAPSRDNGLEQKVVQKQYEADCKTALNEANANKWDKVKEAAFIWGDGIRGTAIGYILNAVFFPAILFDIYMGYWTVDHWGFHWTLAVVWAAIFCGGSHAIIIKWHHIRSPLVKLVAFIGVLMGILFSFITTGTYAAANLSGQVHEEKKKTEPVEQAETLKQMAKDRYDSVKQSEADFRAAGDSANAAYYGDTLKKQAAADYAAASQHYNEMLENATGNGIASTSVNMMTFGGKGSESMAFSIIAWVSAIGWQALLFASSMVRATKGEQSNTASQEATRDFFSAWRGR